uniref:Nuclear RNA export factor 1-like n=1 Tax=Sinocyclocheilus grahami TaxID=75366 RepID=A0A672Q7X3_SINGR
MTRYREWYPNLSVITRVCESSSDPSGSAVVREVWSTESSFTDHDGRWLGVRRGWGSIKARLHSDTVRLQHRGAAPVPRSRFQGGSVDVSVMASQNGKSQHRFIPYGRSSQRGEGGMDKIGGGNAHRFGAEDAERGGENWFKITVRVKLFLLKLASLAHRWILCSKWLLCLNLSNNKLCKLTDIAELVNKAPNLQSLNLSHNELKSEQELDKVKGFRLVELWLDRNPLCDAFKDQTTYISAVRERFPRLLRLDGHVLPPPICFDVETGTNIPACKGSHFVSNEIQGLIQHFLQHYYCVYDSGDRQLLLEAYHDDACFSLSLPSINHLSRLKNYHEHSRNIKNIKDSSAWFHLLKRSRLTVVAFLSELPKTQHDMNSVNVDVNTYSRTLLVFTVSGVFKEGESCLNAVTCVSITVDQIALLCIVNDELFVRNATSEEIHCAFAAPAPSNSPVLPTLAASQQEMLSAFSQMSEMNLEWSQK